MIKIRSEGGDSSYPLQPNPIGGAWGQSSHHRVSEPGSTHLATDPRLIRSSSDIQTPSYYSYRLGDNGFLAQSHSNDLSGRVVQMRMPATVEGQGSSSHGITTPLLQRSSSTDYFLDRTVTVEKSSSRMVVALKAMKSAVAAFDDYILNNVLGRLQKFLDEAKFPDDKAPLVLKGVSRLTQYILKLPPRVLLNVVTLVYNTLRLVVRVPYLLFFKLPKAFVGLLKRENDKIKAEEPEISKKKKFAKMMAHAANWISENLHLITKSGLWMIGSSFGSALTTANPIAGYIAIAGASLVAIGLLLEMTRAVIKVGSNLMHHREAGSAQQMKDMWRHIAIAPEALLTGFCVGALMSTVVSTVSGKELAQWSSFQEYSNAYGENVKASATVLGAVFDPPDMKQIKLKDPDYKIDKDLKYERNLDGEQIQQIVSGETKDPRIPKAMINEMMDTYDVDPNTIEHMRIGMREDGLFQVEFDLKEGGELDSVMKADPFGQKPVEVLQANYQGPKEVLPQPVLDEMYNFWPEDSHQRLPVDHVERVWMQKGPNGGQMMLYYDDGSTLYVDIEQKVLDEEAAALMEEDSGHADQSEQVGSGETQQTSGGEGEAREIDQDKIRQLYYKGSPDYSPLSAEEASQVDQVLTEKGLTLNEIELKLKEDGTKVIGLGTKELGVIHLHLHANDVPDLLNTMADTGGTQYMFILKEAIVYRLRARKTKAVKNEAKEEFKFDEIDS